MTEMEGRLFMLDLAIVQLIAGILVTLGSTLLAISIGFGLTIPEAMQDAILQIIVMKTEVSPEVQEMLVQESLSNYVLVLAAVSALFIIVGVLFASVKTAKIRKQIKANHKIAKLLATDMRGSDPITNQKTGQTAKENESLPTQSRTKNTSRLAVEQADPLDSKA
jgi:hypothetical protein